MADDKVDGREIDYRQLLPWTNIFRGFRVALDPKKLLLAAGGIAVMAFGWWILALMFYSPQSKRPMPDDYPVQMEKFTNIDDEAARTAKARQASWQEFKTARAKWNLLHRAAGNSPVWTDAADLAPSRDEYDRLRPVFDYLDEQVAKQAKTESQLREEILAGKQVLPVDMEVDGKKVSNSLAIVWLNRTQPPYGTLRIGPWFEDRGPNPFLMVTGQAQAVSSGGHFVDWLLTKEIPVLVEPLVKFFLPVVYLVSPEAGFWNRFYFLLVIVWTLATWGLFGGAITRMATVKLARNENVGLMESLRFVGTRYREYLLAPLFPLALVAVVVIGLALFGVIGMIPVVGDIVWYGLLMPLVLIGGLIMAVVLVGLVGWPMMYATISTEGEDSFDAISRSYSYVYQYIWHYAWYSVVALAYGAVVVFFVGLMGSLVVYLGKWSVGQWTTQSRDPSFLFVYAPTSFGWRDLLLQGAMTEGGQSVVQNGVINATTYAAYVSEMTWYNTAGAALVTVWLYLFFLAIVGFGYSYFWSASTIIYLLMRRRVDETDMEEVYLEEEAGPEAYTTASSVPAPPASPNLQMVETPTLRATAPPPEPSPPPLAPKPESEPAPATTPAPTATASASNEEQTPTPNANDSDVKAHKEEE
ncbi:MAG: hypothetical protein ACK4RK_13300 [Gemmataceae bacterium]